MPHAISSSCARALLWSGWVVVGLLLLAVGDGPLYFASVSASALALAAVPSAVPRRQRRRDGQDLLVIATLYVAVVALNAAAFLGFTVQHVAGLFLCFAAALLIGVAGPIVYTVGVRRRSFSDLGLRRDNLRSASGFAMVFAAVQFGLTLWGYDLPAAVDWVPLLVMSLVVGAFESVFFRGFVQARLVAQFGTAPGGPLPRSCTARTTSASA